MSRLFEALSDVEMYQPSPKGIPRAVAPNDVIQLGLRTVDVTPPLFAEQAETEQLSAETVPVEVSASEVTPPLFAEESETEQHSPETVPVEVSPSDVTPPLFAEEAETEQHSPEAVPVEESASEVAPPLFAEQAETEQLSAEAVPVEESASELAPPLFAEESEKEQLLPEAVSVEVSPSEVTPPLSAEQAETEQHSPEAVSVEMSPSEVAPPLFAEESETEQHSAEAVPVEVSASEVPAPLFAQEAAVAKYSKPKSVESAPARPVAVRVSPESRLVALTDPNSLGAEKFRALVTRLEHLHKQRELKCFQVTSSVIHEGKTLVSGNVAVTLAKYSGSKTLLIEGDLHRPTLATIFGLNNIRGLSHWWSRQDQDLAQFVYRLDDLPLWFLPAGKPCDRPSDILRSARFVKAFAQLASRFEWIVVDSTPMLPIVDVNLWSRLVDGTLLVVREGVTPVKALKQGLLALDHPKLIGVVLNDASATKEAKYDGQYYGSTKR
jgi:capsular exopolysaccharide synthesis family protein